MSAAILRLAEQGKLDLDGSIDQYLSGEVNAILRSDGYATDTITVRHLLTHTGGIGDHLVDAFIEAIRTDRDREWTFEGRVFTEPATLATMLTSKVPERGGPFSSGLGPGGYQYCHGIFASEHAGYTIFGHSGAWGTVGGYVPALDLAFEVSISILDRNGRQNALLHRFIDVLVATPSPGRDSR